MNIVVTIREYQKHLNALSYAKSTIDCYSQYLSYFLDYLQKRKINDLKKVNNQVVRDYQAMVLDMPLAMETKALRIRPVKRLFGYLVESNRLLLDPTEGIVETDRKGRKMPPVLSLKEIQHLLEQPNLSLRMQVRNRAIMEVFYSTGIRLDELLNLEVYDVDQKEKVLFIRKGKGNRQRVVPLGKTAIRYLREYLERIRPRYAKCNPRERKIFLTNSGKLLSPQSIRGFIRIYRIQAKIKKAVSPHTFRRTCATHLLQQGADIRHIQQLLGHKHLKTTQLYTKVAPIDVKKTHNQTHPGKELWK